jgi:hypothetical protein
MNRIRRHSNPLEARTSREDGAVSDRLEGVLSSGSSTRWAARARTLSPFVCLRTV